jgi:Protein of unknown function (DUF3325)
MTKHARQAQFRLTHNRRLILVTTGASLLLIAVATLCLAFGWQIGLVDFFAIATVTGIMVAATLAYRPRFLMRAAILSSSAAIVLAPGIIINLKT